VSFLDDSLVPAAQQGGDSKYELEKVLGTRRASGTLNLKRLKPKHLRIIELHCMGHRNKDIAAELGMSQTYVSIVLTDPLVVQEIQMRSTEARHEFDALRFAANDVVRDALEEHRPMGQRLRAADMFYKAQGDYQPVRDGAGVETAEDVIQRMLTLNLQVNVTNSRAGGAADTNADTSVLTMHSEDKS
jgi:hypothetical protein